MKEMETKELRNIAHHGHHKLGKYGRTLVIFGMVGARALKMLN